MVFSDFYSKKAQTKLAKEKNPKRKAPTNVKDEPVSKKKSKDGKKKRSGGDVTATKHKARPEKKARFQKPSEDALKLSEKLKEFSRNKNLDGCLKEYWSKLNDSIRDGHHACIVVDCSARCGKISEGEKIVESLKHVNVETKTALLKGYVHSGEISKAENLFVSMCNEKAKKDLPNTRSLNTLLRGCLWCAASIDKNSVVTGGVVTSEKAWDLYKELLKNGSVSSGFDVSSFEYSVSLLCQALKTEKAESRIKELKSTFSDESSDSVSTSQSVSEALSMSYLALARAYAILYQRKQAISACNLAVDFADKSRKALKDSNVGHDDHGKKGKHVSTVRAESNTLYREHRLSEVKNEAKAIADILEKLEEAPNPRQLARRLLIRLLVLTGGGTTDAEYEITDTSGSAIQRKLVNTAYFNFGLDVALKYMGMTLDKMKGSLRKKDCNRILGTAGLQGGIVQDNGIIDFRRIFNAGTGKVKKRNKKSRPLAIELGSGFGDWIVKLAMASPEKDFISVELRADRVGQTFARTSVLSSASPFENLCIIGAESGSFLSENVQNESVSTIYINHPEPPTQTFGAEATNLEAIMNGEEEPAHMLSSRTIIAAAQCLTNSTDSQIVIVTDNKWYGRLICATLVRILRKHPNLLYSRDLTKHNYERIDDFGDDDTKSRVSLFEGQPDESIAHPKQEIYGKGSSYFDRLWRSGAGSHAETRSRFIIVMSRKEY